MVSRILLVFRTLIHVKLVQILNRLWRKFLPKGTRSYKDSTEPLGEFEFLNTKGNPNGWNDPRFEKLWLYNLHYFEKHCTSELIERWIKENPIGHGNGWEPYPISLRVVNWIKWMLRGQGQSSSSGDLRNSLTVQVVWLSRRLEYHLLANHLLANAKALVFAGKFLGNEKWYRKGMAIYRKELPEQTCADGIHFERSAMYHCIILEDLLDCVKMLKRFDGFDRFERLDEDVMFFRGYAEKMLAGLKLLTGPDGKIAKFNDATEGIAKSPSDLLAFATSLDLPSARSNLSNPSNLSNLSDSSGFLRLENETYCVIAKCGEIGPSYQPGHAHADTWSFELWKGARKLIGDTGCSTYVPGEVRSYERSTAAHNTVVIDGRDSSEVWASHRVGRRFDSRRHKRTFELTADGLKGRDEVFGTGEHCVEVRFHLPPGVDEDAVKISCNGERRVESCEFAVGWNKRKSGKCIVFRQTAKLPATFAWSVF